MATTAKLNVIEVETPQQWIITNEANELLHVQDKEPVEGAKLRPTKSAWIKAVKKQHPEYMFVIDKLNAAITEVDEIYDPNKVDIATGEVNEPTIVASPKEPIVDHPQKPFINPLKTEPMNTQGGKKEESAKAEPIKEEAHIAEPIVKPTVVRRARRGMATGTEFGIKCVTGTTITALLFTADVLVEMAKLVAIAEATAIKPLGLHPDATRAELKEAALQRSEKILVKTYSVPMTVINTVKTVKILRSMNNEPQVATQS